MDTGPHRLRTTAAASLTRARQRGGAAVMMMLLLLGLLVILGVVEVGYLYWTKREVQKVADLAALAGAQQLEQCTTDHQDNLAARRNASVDNSFAGELAIRCGYWGAELPPEARFIDADAAHALNAVQVTAGKQAIPLFGQLPSMPMIRATAVAQRNAPQAAFSVGSRLSNVNSNAPLQSLLRLAGLDLTGTQLASYKGLAGVKITPRGLLQALGVGVGTDISVGDLNNLLAANQVSVGQLLDIAASAASEQGVLGANVGILKQQLANVGLRDLLVRIGSTATQSGLFAQVGGGNLAANGALDAEVNALELVATAIGIANAAHAVSVPQLDLLGLVQAKASVVEPASIAIGPIGTTAYNSQVRLFLDIDTARIPALNAVLGLLGTRIKLPTYIDVIDGFGTLRDVDCSANPATATIDVTSSVANICIGKPVTPWDSTRELCATALQNEELVRLFGSTLLNHKITLAALSSSDRLTLAAGQTGSVQPNELAVGTLITNLTNALFGVVQAIFAPGNTGNPAQDLAHTYLEATKVNGAYQPEAVVALLRDGNANLPAIGSWTTTIPTCQNWLLACTPKTVQGNVFRRHPHLIPQ